MILYIVGIFIGNFFQLGFHGVIILLSLFLSFFINKPKNKKNALIFFGILGLLLGFLKIDNALQFDYERNGFQYKGAGVVVELPKAKPQYKQLVICPLVDNKKCLERFIIYASIHSDFEFGDFVKLDCRLEEPENEFDGFNYKLFLANKNIFYICKNSSIRKSDPSNRSDYQGVFWLKLKLQKKLYNLSASLERRINKLFVQPESGYLGGLLLGGEDRMPKENIENFRKTGTTHTVAVSGFNITIIAEFLILISIAIGFWRGQAFWVAFYGVILFVLMIGAPSSAVRAAVMAIILMWAHNRGRLSKSYYAVVFTAAVMLTIHPLALFHDAGFQLSFLATLGIILIYSPLSKKFGIERDFLELKSIFLVTIAAQLGVLGVIIFNFESFSLSSLFVNLIILPFIPIIMLLGFLTVSMSYFSLFLSQLFSFPVWLLLHFEIMVVDFFAKFDFLMIDFSGVSWIWLTGYYLFFVLLVIYLRRD